MKYVKLISLALFLSMTAVCCKSEYTTIVQDELATGIVNDSLVLGMIRGMTKKDFYSHCWQLNKQEMVHQGSGNQYALYPFRALRPAGDSVSIEMLFYGIFDENDTMRGMDMIYSYPGWSPWSTQYQVDDLVEHLIWLYEKDLGGNPFFHLDLGLDKIKAHVKIDGDRQITIYPKTERQVAVKIEDLQYKLRDDA